MEPREGAARDLGELTARFGFDLRASAQLSRLLDLLTGDPGAPTAIRDRRRAIDDHLADSLVALELEEVRAAPRLVDLGAGAGLPGLPLAIARPELAVTLIESVGRKCEFIRRAAELCGLENVEVVHARAEQWPAGLGRFELATARALAPLEAVCEYAAPLLADRGTLVAWRGKRDPAAEAAAANAASRLGLAPGRVVEVSPYPAARDRHLHVISKIAETPARFPRRPGVALKRPLSGFSGA